MQLLVAERIDVAKDFLVTKTLQLINKVLAEIRKQKVKVEECEPLAITLLEQIKWTLFIVKDNFVPAPTNFGNGR